MERLLKNHTTAIWSTATGEGTGFILCNGGPGCDDYLGPVAAMVDDLCRCVRFEPRGCGRSGQDGQYDLETTINDIEFIRQSWGLGQVVIGGHSAGVDSALAYALKYRESVLGLVGISGGTIVNDREWIKTYYENREKYGENSGGQVFDAEVNAMGNASWRQYIQRPELLRDLAQLEIPAIFLAAGADIRPNWPITQLANLLPCGRYAEVEGAGHYIWLTNPEPLRHELRHAVREILGEVTGTP